MYKRLCFAAALLTMTVVATRAQSVLYPKHFDLQEVRLLDSPFARAQDLNYHHLMEYDVDRLLTPFVRQAGLSATTDASSRYYRWTELHPNFQNWGEPSFDLSGHVGGHYLTALALAYASADDATVKAQMKQRMDYMVNVLNDCQQAFADDNTGLRGFLGGQPMNEVWQKLSTGDTQPLYKKRGWVPFYCQHKVMAGLRDAYVYGGNETAKQMFRSMSDWAVDVVSSLNDKDMEAILRIEHGGMNEVLADAYALFGEKRYLDAAKRYTHKEMLNGFKDDNGTFLDGKHANTQVPKYVGMERIFQLDPTETQYGEAAKGFWMDVINNRTVAIGGNSVDEHFLSKRNSNRYVDHVDGPESCNSNNMLKLTEMMDDERSDRDLALHYEDIMYNHILSTQDPQTGGYVYFTPLRPQSYRVYSQPDKGMWCCVGTGMENHSKYGHFIYTHSGKDTLQVNLFVASTLDSKFFKLRQETRYPYGDESRITMEKGGRFTLAITGRDADNRLAEVYINGKKAESDRQHGPHQTAFFTRKWKKGDVITLRFDMRLHVVEMPNMPDYVAFKYGPLLLAAKTTAASEAESAAIGLPYERLQNEYGGEGRMDHSPGVMGKKLSLIDAPMLIGNRDSLLNRITLRDRTRLTFTIDCHRDGVPQYKWTTLELMPFNELHHARYMMYWYARTEEEFSRSDMAITEQRARALDARTVDFVATGEQQSEAGHEKDYSNDSHNGTYNDETFRDAQSGGYVQYTLYNNDGISEGLALMLRYIAVDAGRKATISVNGVKLQDVTVEKRPSTLEKSGFYNLELPLPSSVMTDKDGNAVKRLVVRMTADQGTPLPGTYHLRLVKEK